MAGVLRLRRQAAHGRYQVLAAQGARLGHGLSLEQLGERGAAGDGGDATFGQKPGLGDAAAVKLQAQAHDVATGWVLDLGDSVGAFSLAHVARVLEVVEKLGRIGGHGRNSNNSSSLEVVLAAWCGAGDRVPLEKIVAQRGWQKVSAVRAGRVYCIRDEYLNTPAPTVMAGLKALAAAIRLDLFPAAKGLRRIALAVRPSQAKPGLVI
jgi:hypothetical protein